MYLDSILIKHIYTENVQQYVFSIRGLSFMITYIYTKLFTDSFLKLKIGLKQYQL